MDYDGLRKKDKIICIQRYTGSMVKSTFRSNLFMIGLLSFRKYNETKSAGFLSALNPVSIVTVVFIRSIICPNN